MLLCWQPNPGTPAADGPSLPKRLSPRAIAGAGRRGTARRPGHPTPATHGARRATRRRYTPAPI
ncbi:hypothetical protein OH686_14560 [Pseudomonas sp. SO81]|nr:hypothetical protein OH686_14560 [Pseudomonas sp. SO81]